jgi:hypothetical protein
VNRINKIENNELNLKEKNDSLSRMILLKEDEKKFSKDELISNLNLFFTAGYERLLFIKYLVPQQHYSGVFIIYQHTKIYNKK